MTREEQNMKGKKSNKTDSATKGMTLKQFRHHCKYYDACGFSDKYCHIHSRDCFRWK